MRDAAGRALTTPPAPGEGDEAAAGREVPLSSCEVPRTGLHGRDACVLRYDGAGWEGVPVLPYKPRGDDLLGVTRRLLAAPDAAAFELRYFEVAPGGHSTFERHEHVHVVIGFRGAGRVRLGHAVHDVGRGDVVYVAPGMPHQFLNADPEEPFGFLCIVDSERDRPVPMGG